jgi:hypothetical protein
MLRKYLNNKKYNSYSVVQYLINLIEGVKNSNFSHPLKGYITFDIQISYNLFDISLFKTENPLTM